uniref:Ubiquitin carboxyl-terminal hydrolase MINDY n=1 Tax=Callorhinchus milii TaxID=7868 RepID=A0A4W3K072_CALMI|eukprot:gi/632982668/ref/XP_007908263.1/ PREDICTED: protein FAM188B [Callorhinchus milii]
MDNNGVVQEMAASLVREYLSRKGLKKTIAAMDQEFPRSETSINNRNELKKVLHLESLYKQNKDQLMPFRTMLEIITKYFLESSENAKNLTRDSIRTPAILNQRGSTSRIDNTFINIYDLCDEDKGGGLAVSELNKTEICRLPNDSYGAPCMSVSSSKTLQSIHKKKERISSSNSIGGCPSGGEPGLLPTSLLPPGSSVECGRVVMFPVESRGTESHKIKSSRIVRGMMTGPVATLQEDSSRKRLSKRASGSSLFLQPNDSDSSSGLKCYARQAGSMLENAASPEWLSPNPSADGMIPAEPTPVLDYPQKKTPASILGVRSSLKPQDARIFSDALDDPATDKMSDRDRRAAHSGQERKTLSNLNSGPHEKNKKVSFAPESTSLERKSRENSTRKTEDLYSRKPTLCSSPANQLEEWLQIADIDDEELSDVGAIPDFSVRKHHIDSKPIDLTLATDLKNLLFGSSLCCFTEEWKMQSFTFNELPNLKYGLVQKKGGPCGVLAVIQASVLQYLLFEDVNNSSIEAKQLQPTSAQRSQSLAMAIATILWRAGDKRKAVVALSTGRQQFIPVGRYKSDGSIETLILNTVTNYEDLSTFVQQNVGQFEVGPFGCILLTLSAILSRSIELVISDFDVPASSLIGAHGYCTQELVNLLLTGRAVSNVFNDVVDLDSGNGNITVLKGITGRSDIGLLSLFEHYSICKVGSYLKTPRFPIWVVCSESHFSVLFSLKKELMNDWKFERKFDMYYYDGLANQQDEIRLTIDAPQTCVVTREDDLIPPLENCIRTKWKGAVIDWNGTEPIL